MDFDAAIKSHSDWKMKLQRYLKNPDNSINVDELAKDNVCGLGKWLYGEGKSQCKSSSDYQELVTAHKSFHKAASEVVLKKNKGESVSEEVALGGNSPFAQHSSQVINLLMKFKRQG